MLMPEIDGPDRGTAPRGGQILNEGVVGARVTPAFDAPHVAGEFASTGAVVGPDVAVTAHAVATRVGDRGPDVEGRGAVDRFFKGGGNAGEFGDVGAPFGANGMFAMAGGDAADDVVDEGLVACGIGGDVEGEAASRAAGGGGGEGRVLLLEV